MTAIANYKIDFVQRTRQLLEDAYPLFNLGDVAMVSVQPIGDGSEKSPLGSP